MTLPDGRRALLLAYRPTGSSGLECDRRALEQALAVAPAEVVLFCPDGSDVGPLLQAATMCGASDPVLATAAPVTDAVKRVVGDVVLATVDRAGLAWPVGPAAVDAAMLRRRLQDAPGPTVHPLASGTGVVWL